MKQGTFMNLIIAILVLLLPGRAVAGEVSTAVGGITYIVHFNGSGFGAVADYASVSGSDINFSGMADLLDSVTAEYTWEEPQWENGHIVGHITYTRYLTAPVTKIRDNVFKGRSNLTAVNIPTTIKTIGGFAFSNTGLTSLVLPSSIDTIWRGAFGNCTQLKNITIYCSPSRVPDDLGEEAYIAPFGGCGQLETVEFHCKHIKKFFHQVYPGVQNIIIGSEVDTIGEHSLGGVTFYNVTNLYMLGPVQCILSWPQPRNLYIYDLTEHLNSGWDPDIFFDQYYSLDAESFWGYHAYCESGEFTYINGTLLNDLTIPNVDSIPPQFFQYNKGLTRVNTGDQVTKIGAFAFDGCLNLKDVIIGNTVTTVKGNAFGDCGNLENITVGENVQCIGSDQLWIDESGKYKEVLKYSAFSGCYSIKSVTWNAINCESLGLSNDEMGSCIFDYGIQEIVFGNKVKYIPSYFAQYDDVDTLIIPASVQCIGEYAFYNSSINTLYWNAENCELSVSSNDAPIQEKAPFYSARYLKHIYIGSEVKSIGGPMFSTYEYDNGYDDYIFCEECGGEFCVEDNSGTCPYCGHINEYDFKKVTCSASVPPTITAVCFSQATYQNALLEVPEGSLQAYREAEGWKEFQHIIAISGNVTPGDVNGDGGIDISDVTVLIDLLLSGDEISVGADVNGDGQVDISDVTVLIDRLLTEN